MYIRLAKCCWPFWHSVLCTGQGLNSKIVNFRQVDRHCAVHSRILLASEFVCGNLHFRKGTHGCGATRDQVKKKKNRTQLNEQCKAQAQYMVDESCQCFSRKRGRYLEIGSGAHVGLRPVGSGGCREITLAIMAEKATLTVGQETHQR